MRFPRIALTAAATALLISSTLTAAPASAQPGGCTQSTSGSPTNTTNRSQRQNSAAVLPAVIAAAVQNVTVPIEVLSGQILNNTNLSVVCLNDTLNQNDIRVLQDILNQSPILSQNQNNLNNLLRGADIDVLNGVTILQDVNVLAFDINTGSVYVLR